MSGCDKSPHVKRLMGSDYHKSGSSPADRIMHRSMGGTAPSNGGGSGEKHGNNDYNNNPGASYRGGGKTRSCHAEGGTPPYSRISGPDDARIRGGERQHHRIGDRAKALFGKVKDFGEKVWDHSIPGAAVNAIKNKVQGHAGGGRSGFWDQQHGNGRQHHRIGDRIEERNRMRGHHADGGSGQLPNNPSTQDNQQYGMANPFANKTRSMPGKNGAGQYPGQLIGGNGSQRPQKMGGNGTTNPLYKDKGNLLGPGGQNPNGYAGGGMMQKMYDSVPPELMDRIKSHKGMFGSSHAMGGTAKRRRHQYD